MDSSSLEPIVGFSFLELVVLFGSLELVGLSQGLGGIILYFNKILWCYKFGINSGIGIAFLQC